MWMSSYILAVKRALRDQHGFTPKEGSTENEPLLDVPDGEYPVSIDGKVDTVRIADGKIHCCNFEQAA